MRENEVKDNRERIITRTSAVGILSNILIAGTKVAIGWLASSIAIVSEGVNNGTDALTSVITLIGTKLAGKKPDEKHPFGYGRMEYLTSLVIAVVILVTGVEMLRSSVELIFRPEPLHVSLLSLIVVAVSAAAKFLLGVYIEKKGKETGCGALEAVGVDSKNDCFASVITLASAALFLLWDCNIDAYAGVLTSALILKAGYEVLMDTVSELLGRPGEKELALRLYKEIRSTDGILNAVDMMLHNYGPDAYSGSVNVEMDHALTVGEAYQILHELQLRIMHEYDVTMVFGIYAVDNDREYVRDLRRTIGAFVKETEHVKSFHAVFLDPSSDLLYCDLIVDYDLADWTALSDSFREYMKRSYPDKKVVLTVETEFV